MKSGEKFCLREGDSERGVTRVTFCFGVDVEAEMAFGCKGEGPMPSWTGFVACLALPDRFGQQRCDSETQTDSPPLRMTFLRASSATAVTMSS
jgi:hypothetical protein